jgi:hypothetical protein
MCKNVIGDRDSRIETEPEFLDAAWDVDQRPNTPARTPPARDLRVEPTIRASPANQSETGSEAARLQLEDELSNRKRLTHSDQR